MISSVETQMDKPAAEPRARLSRSKVIVQQISRADQSCAAAYADQTESAHRTLREAVRVCHLLSLAYHSDGSGLTEFLACHSRAWLPREAALAVLSKLRGRTRDTTWKKLTAR
jgi:hypothetical protein